MYITENIPDIKYVPVVYRNSGDTPYYGDKSRVVGYYSIAVTKETGTALNESRMEKESVIENDFSLSAEDKEILIDIARSTVEDYVNNKEIPEIDTKGFSKNLFTNTGAFVTLHKNGKLRGCIGRFEPDIQLYKVVQDMAISAASRDYRFSPVKPDELKNIDIEISVLTPLKKIQSIDEIVPGRHGIYIKKGYSSGTFLPQVASQTGWSVEEFLGHCSRDKAGIGWDGWKEADLYTYEALIFSEKEMTH